MQAKEIMRPERMRINGVTLQARLMELNMSQHELARRLGVNPSFVSYLINGKRDTVSTRIARRLIIVLKLENNVDI